MASARGFGFGIVGLGMTLSARRRLTGSLSCISNSGAWWGRGGPLAGAISTTETGTKS
jgi:hypothetical protein